MTTFLRTLIVEDLPNDAELMVLRLLKGGYQLDWQRVQTEPDYLAALDTNPDLILRTGPCRSSAACAPYSSCERGDWKRRLS